MIAHDCTTGRYGTIVHPTLIVAEKDAKNGGFAKQLASALSRATFVPYSGARATTVQQKQ